MLLTQRPEAPRLELRGIAKRYGALLANDGIDLAVQPGEIHAVLGENGAGKSTLMKIVYGVTQPSAGEIRWCGERVEVASPRHARQLGIGMVFQHFALFETLTVVENVALALPGRPDLDDLASRIEAVARRYGLPADPHRPVHALAVGERQRVEIIRCLLQNPRLLIMDEPTSVLTPQAVKKLFETLRQLAAEGCSILYISHKLDEIQALCHGATILRQGRVTGHCRPQAETPQSMARLMIGKELPVCRRAVRAVEGEPRLQLANLTQPAPDPFGVELNDIDLEVRAGEIVGIAGVSGNGQQELLAAISGERPAPTAEAVRIGAVAAGRLGAAQRRRLGLGFVPEERLGRGAVPRMSLASNALLTAHAQGMLRHGLVLHQRARAFAQRCIAEYAVACGGPDAAAQSLSGGNLQKFIVGREILQAPDVLVAAQPTWGVDVGAAAFIRQRLIRLRDEGTAVLVISEELDELFEVCDRIAVIAGGRLSPAVATEQLTLEKIGVWMSGLWPERAELAADAPSATPGDEEVPHVAQA
jgi:general nucleoside transport system ATP-binding protein